MTALLFIAGLVTLVAGGELLVRGAARLAAATGISPLVIGLTVVAFGTSSPELAVSVQAGLAGQADIAVGNVIGSNIFNVLFILGLSAAIVPLVVSAQLVRLDVPVMIGVSFVLLAMSANGHIARVESLLLVLMLGAYIAMQVVLSRRTPNAVEPMEGGGTRGMNVLLIIIGLALLVMGSRWLVDASVRIAELLGISQLVIGLTVVAMGTSMPELATSVIAGIRGQRDIAVGNVIGSNIFNILAVLGFSGLVTTGGIGVSHAAVAIDIPVMIAVAVICFPIFISTYSINRWEGGLFVAYYVIYTTYLILDTVNHDAFGSYRTIVITVVLPLTLLTVAAFSLRNWLAGRR